MCYATDARSFVVGNSLGEIVIYDTKEYMPLAYIQGDAPATALAMSSNNYFIAAGTGQTINIWNFQTKELRKAIPMSAVVKELTFSPRGIHANQSYEANGLLGCERAEPILWKDYG